MDFTMGDSGLERVDLKNRWREFFFRENGENGKTEGDRCRERRVDGVLEIRME